MARAKTDPTIDGAAPKASSPWLLLQDAYQRFRTYLEPSEAGQRLIDLLCQWPSMPCKKRYVKSNREEILPVADGQIEGIELSIEIEPITGADYLGIRDTIYSHPAQFEYDGPAEFLVPAASIERELERLYPAEVSLPPEPSKKPTPKKKRREAKSAPVKARRRGPKAEILPRLTAAMNDDIENQKLSLDELEAMSDKELQGRYSAKRDRVRAARQSVIDELKK